MAGCICNTVDTPNVEAFLSNVCARIPTFKPAVIMPHDGRMYASYQLA